MAPIPQTRPPPPPTPCRKHPTTGAIAVGPKRRFVTDASDALREGKLDDQCAFYDIVSAVAVSKGSSCTSPKRLAMPVGGVSSDDEIEIVMDSPSNTAAIAGATASRSSPSHRAGSSALPSLASLAKGAAGGDSDSDDDMLPGSRATAATQGVAKSAAVRSLLSRAKVTTDSDDDDDLPLRTGTVKPAVKKAMASLFSAARAGLADSDDDEPPQRSNILPTAKAKAVAEKRPGCDSDTSESDGQETAKYKRWAKGIERGASSDKSESA